MSHRKLALLVALSVMALVVQARPIHDLDLFWQVKSGQLILRDGGLPDVDPFSAVRPDVPPAPVGWLGQVACAGLHSAGSWRLLHQANALALAAALALAVWPLRRREASLRAALLAMAMAFVVMLPHADVRPQSLGVLAFAALLALARSRLGPWSKLVLAGALLLVWQNVHPSAVMGAIALGAVAAARWLKAVRRRRQRPWTITCLAAMAALASLATPAGVGYFETAAYNAWVSKHLGVSEWTPWWDPSVWQAKASAWGALAVSLGLLALVRRRARLEDVALFAAMTAVALPAYRLSLFWAVALAPVWARWIEIVAPVPRAAHGRRFAVRPAVAAAGVAAVLLVALGAPRLARTRLFDPQVPLAAVEALHALDVRGVIYNYREWSGPLIWMGHPDWKVTIDGRLYRYRPEQWRLYEETALGRVAIEDIERTFHPRAFFLRPGYHGRLIERLRAHPGWVEAYGDPLAVIFLPGERDGGRQTLAGPVE